MLWGLRGRFWHGEAPGLAVAGLLVQVLLVLAEEIWCTKLWVASPCSQPGPVWCRGCCATAQKEAEHTERRISAMVAMPGEGRKGHCVWLRGVQQQPRCGEAARLRIGAASSDQALAGLQFPHEMETALLVSVTSQMWRRNDFSLINCK